MTAYIYLLVCAGFPLQIFILLFEKWLMLYRIFLIAYLNVEFIRGHLIWFLGYVQKITACKEIDVMEDLDNGKPP